MNKAIQLFFVLAIFSTTLLGQTVVSPKYSVDGEVYSMQTKGNNLILGGNFTHVGVYTGNGAVFNLGSEVPDLDFPKLIGTIELSTPDGNGGFYVYGNFYKETEDMSLAHRRIEHIQSDGTFEAGFSLAVDSLFSLSKILYHEGRLYIGGDHLYMIAGQASGNFCAVDLQTQQLVSWMPVLDETHRIESFGISQNTLYFSGNFTEINGTPRNSCAAIELETGILKPWNPAIGEIFTDIRFYQDKAVISGGFHDGVFEKHACAKIDLNTGQNLEYLFDQNTLYWAAGVSRIAISGDILFAYSAGTFDTRITAINLITNAILWEKYFSMINFARDMEVVNDSLYVAGTLTQTYMTNQPNSDEYYEQDVPNFFRLDTQTGNVENWNPGVASFNTNAYCMSYSGGRFFVGGDFTLASSFKRRNICIIDLENNVVLPFNVNFDFSDIYAIKAGEGVLYAGGNIVYIDGITYNKPVLSFDINTGQVLPWEPSINGDAKCIELSGDNVFVGGCLTEAEGGLGRQHLFAVNKNDAGLGTWSPNPDFCVNALCYSGDRLYVGGEFSNISGEGRSKIAAYSTDNLALSGWNPPVDAYSINAITDTDDNTIWVGGAAFFGIPNTVAGLFAGLDRVSGNITDVPLNDYNFGSVNAIAKIGKWVVGAGSFDFGDSNSCNNMLMYDRLGNMASTPAIFCNNFENGTIRGMAVHNNDIYIGGGFLKINGLADNSNVSRVQYTEDFLGITQDGSSDGVSLYPNPADNEFTLQLRDGLSPSEVNLYDMTGNRLVIKPLDNGILTHYLIEGEVSQGLYILKIMANEKTFYKKLILK